MVSTIKDIVNTMEKIAPSSLAMNWDNVGLQLGTLEDKAKGILLALNYNDEVLQEAIEKGANLVIVHHPFLMKALSQIRVDKPQGQLIFKTLQEKVNLYVAHTNLDIADGGVNDALAISLGLEKTDVLENKGVDSLEKIVVFVPLDQVDEVRDAIGQAGGGWIGNYSHCTFKTEGTGTFKAMAGTNPFIGEQGKLEKVNEYRLETIVPRSIRDKVIFEMIKAHPYEEVAYDIYPLSNSGKPHGLGRIGNLKEKITLREFLVLVKENLRAESLKVTGDPESMISRVALCGGAGASLIDQAIAMGADLLLTGDVKYHQAQEAYERGLMLVDAGHDITENIVLPTLRLRLMEEMAVDLPVYVSAKETAYWRYY